MAKHTIKIKVSLDLDNCKKTNNYTHSSLEGVNVIALKATKENIHESGLNDSKTLQQIPATAFDTISCSTFSNIKGSLERSNELYEITTTINGKEPQNDY